MSFGNWSELPRFEEMHGKKTTSIDIPSDWTEIGEDPQKKKMELEAEHEKQRSESDRLLRKNETAQKESSQIAKETEAPFRHPESPEAINIKNELETEFSREFL